MIAAWGAIDRVDRIEPRVGEQPERRRRNGRPFPAVDGERKREPAPEPAAPPAAEREDDPDEPHLIDLLVRARLPSRQILPGRASAAGAN
jgi:hypothetical protein